MSLKADERRAFEVFSVLQELWLQKQGVFNDIVLPEEKMIATMQLDLNCTSKEDIARILFAAAIFMRGGIISEDPLKMFPYLLKNYPQLFNPDVVAADWTSEMIAEVIAQASNYSFSGDLMKSTNNLDQLSFDFTQIQSVLSHKNKSRRAKTSADRKKIYKENEFSKAWHNNFSYVSQCWNGNVLDMYKEVKEFEQFFSRVEKNIFGMRRKILSLFTIWLQNFKVIDVFPCPLPIDFHALRVLFCTGIFSLNTIVCNHEKYPNYAGKIGMRISDSFITKITQWSQKFMTTFDFNHSMINPALWVLSRELCAFNYQNMSRDDGHTVVDAAYLEKHHAWPKNYTHPCLCCPLQQYCSHAIPSAPYYHWGIFLISGKRVNFPMKSLPRLNLQAIPLRTRRNNRN